MQFPCTCRTGFTPLPLLWATLHDQQSCVLMQRVTQASCPPGLSGGAGDLGKAASHNDQQS